MLNARRAILGGKGFPSLNLNFIAMGVAGLLDSRITYTGASNKTMFDSQGRMVWAPANMLLYSNDISNAAWISAGSATKTGTNQLNFTASTVDKVQVSNATGASTPGCSWTCSATLSGSGVIALYMYDNGGSYPGTAGAWITLTSIPTRYAITRTHTDAGASSLALQILNTAAAAATIVVNNVQVERTGVDSPKAYNPTTNTAYYGPRFDYDPSTILSYTYGPEGLSNPTFSSAGIGWASTAQCSFTGGVANVVSTDGTYQAITATIPPTTIGVSYAYRVVITAFSGSANSLSLVVGGGSAAFGGVGTFTGTIVATSINSILELKRSGGGMIMNASLSAVSLTVVTPVCAPLGLLVEESRANLIPVSGSTGAAVAGNLLPTNWAINNSIGLTATVMAVGASNGVDYTDIRIQGNASAAGTVQIRSQGTTFTTADSWACAGSVAYACSAYAMLAAGSNINITGVGLLAQQSLADGSTFVTNAIQTAYTLPSTGTLSTNRVSYSLTSAATTVRARLYFLLNVAAAGVVDITVRIGGFQAEVGGFATSLIPTSGTAATRAADSPTMSTAGWLNPAAGTLYAEYVRPPYILSTAPQSATLSDGSLTNRVQLQCSAGNITVIHRSGGVTYDYAGGSVGTVALGSVGKHAVTYKALGAEAVQGGLPQISATAVAPVGMTTLGIGVSASGTAYGVNWIRAIRYYPRALPLPQLQALTT